MAAREDAHTQASTHSVSPGGGHTWEEADSSALTELDQCCSPTAENKGCWLPEELASPCCRAAPITTHQGRGPPLSPGRLQWSPAEWEMLCVFSVSQGECWIKGAKIRHENKEVANFALCFTDLTSTPHPLGQSRSPQDHLESFPPQHERCSGHWPPLLAAAQPSEGPLAQMPAMISPVNDELSSCSRNQSSSNCPVKQTLCLSSRAH